MNQEFVSGPYPCAECGSRVRGDVLGSQRVPGARDDMPFDSRYELVACQGCEAPALLRYEEVYDGRPPDRDSSWEPPIRVWPQNPHVIGAAVPPAIREAYRQAADCLFLANSTEAAAMMCRLVLERTYKQQNISAKNLHGGIQGLRYAEIIDAKLYSWAEELRLAGNAAAHQVDPELSRQDAEDLVHFTHALLEYVFTLTERFREFKERRIRNRTES